MPPRSDTCCRNTRDQPPLVPGRTLYTARAHINTACPPRSRLRYSARAARSRVLAHTPHGGGGHWVEKGSWCLWFLLKDTGKVRESDAAQNEKNAKNMHVFNPLHCTAALCSVSSPGKKYLIIYIFHSSYSLHSQTFFRVFVTSIYFVVQLLRYLLESRPSFMYWTGCSSY